MLRPATPLTILLLAAFALLVISILSTPIVKGIPLASYDGVNFGVFGYCKGNSCSKVEIGYNTADLYNAEQTKTFDLPVSTRTTLSAILIVHPIAAFFTLVLLVLAGVAHVHSPSHSARYLLGMFILSILTLLLALLSFLIDVLLFVPHMAWGSYLVLAATILIAASGLVSCAMRRTVVSRKARAKRIAENAEMNGDNFYARQAAEPLAPMPPQTTMPLSNGPGADKLPAFATFETPNKEKERTSDERIPLTARTPSERSPPGENASLNGTPDRYGGPPRMGGAPGMNNSRFNGPPQRDQYGNVIPPQNNYGPPGMGRSPSQERMMNGYAGNGYRGRGGPPGGYRGRGGPGYGRGGFNPNMRGGYGGPGRGGPGGMMGAMGAGAMMRGGRGQPPGYSGGPMYRRDPSPNQYGRSESQPPYRTQSGDQPPYGVRSGSQPPPSPGARYGGEGYGDYNPERQSVLPRAESPPPLDTSFPPPGVGEAVEMNAATGSPSRSYAAQFPDHNNAIRDSDSDIAGMVGLQQQALNRHNTVTSDNSASHYSNEPYVPPRQAWTNDQNQAGRTASPLRPAVPPINTQSPTSPTSSHHRSASGDHYYEDVPPAFAEPIEPPIAEHPSAAPPPGAGQMLPPSLTPGLAPGGNRNGNAIGAGENLRQPGEISKEQYLHPSGGGNMENNNSYEDIQEGARSPAESDRSNFTSVSQRGINPRWTPNDGPMPMSRGGPGPGMGYGGGPPMPPPGGMGMEMGMGMGMGMNGRRQMPMGPPPPQAQQRNEILLDSNPDFGLPGVRPGHRIPAREGGGGGAMSPMRRPVGGQGMGPGGGGGMVPRSAYEGGSVM